MGAAGHCAMAVMAKAPRPNHVKTRLVPPLTPQEAAALNASFLRDITDNIREAGRSAPIAGYVAYAPAGAEALFDGILAPGTRLLLADGSIDVPADVSGFGRSLLHATAALLELGYGAMCLVNADSPTLPTAFLHQAAALLAQPGDRMVLGASDDGGYYLIGLKTPHAAVFGDIAWSTDRVAAQTVAQARRIGLDVALLPPWFDVDDAGSLRRLIGDLARTSDDTPPPYAATATRAWIATTDLARRLGGAAPPKHPSP